MPRFLYGLFCLAALANIVVIEGLTILSAESGLILPGSTDFAFKTSNATFYFMLFLAIGTTVVFASAAYWFRVPGWRLWLVALSLPFLLAGGYRLYMTDRYPPWDWPDREVWLEEHGGRMPDFYYEENAIEFPEEPPPE